MATTSCIIVTGNPIDGLGFIGWFEDRETATKWARAYLEQDWWIAPLQAPSEIESSLEPAA